jgi:hypothetical protein
MAPLNYFGELFRSTSRHGSHRPAFNNLQQKHGSQLTLGIQEDKVLAVNVTARSHYGLRADLRRFAANQIRFASHRYLAIIAKHNDVSALRVGRGRVPCGHPPLASVLHMKERLHT